MIIKGNTEEIAALLVALQGRDVVDVEKQKEITVKLETFDKILEVLDRLERLLERSCHL